MTSDCTSGSLRQVAQQNPLTEGFEQIVLAALKEWNVPGASIAIVDKDEVFTKGYGYASLPDIAATPDTLWYAGSSTKMQTCATLAQIIDEKRHTVLSKGWQTPFQSIIPDDFVVQNEWATQHLTLEDAACHRTGFDRHDIAILRDLNGKPATLRDQVRHMRHFSFVHEPRMQCEYSNWPYFALSYVIETLEGKPLGKVMKEVIWNPLGMNSTYADLEDAVAAPEHLSTGYSWDIEARAHKALQQTTVREASGAGCIITTVSDLAKWLRCMLNEGKSFSKAAHADLQRPRVIYNHQPARGKDIVTYGLGVTRTLYRGQVYFEHGGTTEGHATTLIWLPDLKFGVAIMANAAPTGNYFGTCLAHKLIDDKIGVPVEDRIDFATSYHKQMEQMCDLQTDAAVLRNRADPPMPSPVDIGKLAGSYHNAGYGTLSLRLESDPTKDAPSDAKMLVVNRNDVWLYHTLELRHVSGDWWMVYLTLQDNNTMKIAFPADFKVGVDGEPSTLNIEFKNDMLGMDEGAVLFKRIKETV